MQEAQLQNQYATAASAFHLAALQLKQSNELAYNEVRAFTFRSGRVPIPLLAVDGGFVLAALTALNLCYICTSCNTYTNPHTACTLLIVAVFNDRPSLRRLARLCALVSKDTKNRGHDAPGCFFLGEAFGQTTSTSKSGLDFFAGGGEILSSLSLRFGAGLKNESSVPPPRFDAGFAEKVGCSAVSCRLDRTERTAPLRR